MASIPEDRPPAGTHPASTGPAGGLYGSGLQKLAAASGILFVVFLIAALFAGDATTPDYDAPGGEYAAYASEHANSLKVGLLLTMFAAYWLLWFAGVLRSALGEAEAAARGHIRMAHVILAGATVTAVGMVLSGAIRAGVANEPAGTDPEIIRAVVHVADSAGALIPLGLAALTAAAGLAMAHTGAFPRWLGILGLAVGALYLLLFFYALALEDADSPLGFAWPLAMLGMFVWTLGTSLTLLRRLSRPATRTD